MPFDFMLNDGDKNGLMATIHKMDRAKGLDLVLHIPGGDMAATESLIDHLRSMFGTDIRVIVPQIAMSGGTMIALAAKEIVMGKHSNIGPIDPQFGAIPAHAIKEEFFPSTKIDVQAIPSPSPLPQLNAARIIRLVARGTMRLRRVFVSAVPHAGGTALAGDAPSGRAGAAAMPELQIQARECRPGRAG